MDIAGSIFVVLLIYALEVNLILIGSTITVEVFIALVVVVFLGMKSVLGYHYIYGRSFCSEVRLGGNYSDILIFGKYGSIIRKEGECERGHLKDSAHSGSRSNAARKERGGVLRYEAFGRRRLAQAKHTLPSPLHSTLGIVVRTSKGVKSAGSASHHHPPPQRQQLVKEVEDRSEEDCDFISVDVKALEDKHTDPDDIPDRR